jgi:hypothetical protein
MKTALTLCELAFITLGVALLAVYAFFRDAWDWLFQAYDSWSFDQVLKDRTHEVEVEAPRLPEGNNQARPLLRQSQVANYRDWAPARVLAHERSLKRNSEELSEDSLIPP